MSTGLWLRVKALFGRRRFERDLRDEMSFHLAMREEKLRNTAGDGNAATSAKKEFGNPTRTSEECREMRSFVFFETLWQDVRFGARLLRRSPVFSAVAIITLALGIGANTAIFSITYQVLLQLLPVPHPEELVVLRSPGPKQGHVSSDGDDATSFSYPIYKDIRDRSGRVFTGVLARYAIPLSVSGLGNTERATGELVSGNYFEVLGVRPALGRILGSQDETSLGANRVALLSYGYWTRHFGNDPAVLNKQITVNGTLLTVVGVSQPGFTGVQIGQQPDIFIPITMKPQMEPNSNALDRTDHWAALLARLKPGLSRSEAESALPVIFRPILEEDMTLEKISPRRKDQFLARKLLLDDGSHGREIVQTGTRGPLIMLSAMVGLVLIIACANLAGLLIARGEARQREIAVRLSLGASRARVLRLLLTEGFLLAVCGAAAGLVIAPPLLRTMVHSIPKSAGLSGLHADLNFNLFFFALGISLFSVLIFALFPALRLLRVSVQSQLKDQSNAASAGAAGAALRKWLIVTQVILTTVLLAAAGLFTRSLINLRYVHLGFNPDHLVEFSIAPELNGYTPAQEVQLVERLRQNISGLPGVRSVSAAEIPVMADDEASSNITVEGYTTAENENTDTARNLVGPEYFSTMNIPLLAGREFLESDTATSPKVAIINQKLVERYFAGRDPLGQRLMLGASNTRKPDIEIVGVVANSKSDNPRKEIAPFMYLPYKQDPKMGHVTFYVRTTQDPASAANSLRAALAAVDSALPVYALMTVGERRDESIFTERFMAALCAIMGLLAAVLAAIGLYGLMAYIVARRTREIGIRMALGASRSGVAWLVLSEVVRMTAIGLLVGLVCAVVVGHVIASQLYEVSGTNPLVLMATTCLLGTIALLAGSLPARRAARVEPTIALRYE
ncbi:MAG TPA: ABC transporter permease [Candidatus Angelobacter sp.]|nr:ABC transporter permease [Candidatus Angelobacter sp.]